MRAISVSAEYLSPAFENISLLSHVSLKDCDTAFLDIEEIYKEIDPGNDLLLSANQMDRLTGLARERLDQIDHLTRVGKVVFIAPPIRKGIYVQRPPIMKGLEDLFADTVLRAEPYEHMEGQNIEFVGEEFLQYFYLDIAPWIRYNVTATPGFGRPFIRVMDSHEVVGSYLPYNNGWIFFLPHFASKIAGTLGRQIGQEFLRAIQKLIPLLPKKIATEVELPQWASEFLLPGESEINLKITKTQETISEMQQALSGLNESWKDFQKLKILLAGKGTSLEAAVKSAVTELGIAAVEGPPGEEDLQIELSGRRGVVEVKGPAGSASLKNARQLEHWCNKDLDGESQAKGILIINAFCDTPVKDRTETPFPQNVVEFSKVRGHCLITGIQLLNLVARSRLSPKSRQSLAASLFDTAGVHSEEMKPIF